MWDTIQGNHPVEVIGLKGKRVSKIACGMKHTLAILESGELYSWGWNCRGQLGLGDDKDRYEPTKISSLEMHIVRTISCGSYYSMAVLGGSNDGDLYSWGSNYDGQLGQRSGGPIQVEIPIVVEALLGKRIMAISCGYYHSLAITGANPS